jgi:acyl-CoA thioester hydrolase
MIGPVTSDVRVRYYETDKMGVVYHTHYLVWFEIGRTEFLRAQGSSYREMEERDLFMPVLEAYCRYRRPARYDDRVRVETRCQRVQRTQLRFDYLVTREEDAALLAEGYTVHAATDSSGTPRRLPPEIVRHLFPDGSIPP